MLENCEDDAPQLSRRSMLAAAMAAVCLLPAKAIAGNWKKLGSRSVRLIGDHDVIPVTFVKGGFKKIQLKVRENGIHINDLAVVYSTGGNDNIPIRSFIPKGGESRVIDLRGGDRLIRSIHLTYRSVASSKGRAEVAVWGKD